MIIYDISNFVDDNGNEPIIDWINSLDKTARKRILLRLERLKYGNFGDHKQINTMLYELRFSFGSGYRIYYSLENNKIILLINGGNKKTQKQDIQKANDILKKLKGI